ncbi:ABC transporter permease [Streptomyces sp. NPDC050560]|uniref:ABC transporter permease n=1 Tax=Streptomyces sp. NPDC050560 TaxID=3365630 RepID=UPI0037BC9A37
MTTPQTPPTPPQQPAVPYGAPPAPGPFPAPGGHADAWQAAPGGSYTSPIPIRRTHLGNALTSEWTKIRTVRSTMWTLGVFLILVIGVGLILTAQTKDNDYGNVPYTLPAFFGLMLGQICLITLGVLVITSEYGTGMIRTTLTASPQRHRVLAAKFLVFFAVAFVVSFVSILLVGLAASSMHSGASSVGMGPSLLKGSLYVSLLGVLGLAVGAMLRHSAGAVTTMMGVVLLPAIVPAFLMLADSLKPIGRKMLDYNAPNALAKIFGLDDGSGGGTPQLWLLVVVTAGAVAGAFALLDRRDV